MRRHLPEVMEKHQLHRFELLAERYESLPKAGLKITATLGSGYTPSIDGAIHLDGLLSWAVANSHPCPPLFKGGNTAQAFPLPLRLLWVSSEGLPLWAGEPLMPEGERASGLAYWHKRFPLQRMNDWCVKPNTSKGRGAFKEFRVPMKTIVPADGKVTGHCIGHQAEIERLLSYVHFLGKKPAQGRGAVLKWVVEEADVRVEAILSTKPIPCEYSGRGDGVVMAWTPPYWYRPWHRACQ